MMNKMVRGIYIMTVLMPRALNRPGAHSCAYPEDYMDIYLDIAAEWTSSFLAGEVEADEITLQMPPGQG